MCSLPLFLIGTILLIYEQRTPVRGVQEPSPRGLLRSQKSGKLHFPGFSILSTGIVYPSIPGAGTWYRYHRVEYYLYRVLGTGTWYVECVILPFSSPQNARKDV